jgi:RNA recognition motif-containing protein
VHLLRRPDGRASGDAYAVFDTEDAATEALKYDKQKLGNRWIDLFRSSKGELYSITALGGIMLPPTGPAADVQATTSALGEGHTVVKLRGLPWGVTPEDIAAFLSPIPVPEGGVHLMNGGNGRPSGVAYVELHSEDDQKEAVAKDKQSIGGRYIDVFPCSQTELQARLTGGLERGNVAMGGAMVSGSDSEFVKLRGLPYSVQEHEIIAFFQPLPVVAVQVAYNQSGQPSGFGFVQFRSAEDANVALGRSNQVLGSRYVEIFRCTRLDMEQVCRSAPSLGFL